jgi:hypothetical protein
MNYFRNDILQIDHDTLSNIDSKTVDIYFSDNSLSIPYYPTRNCESITKDLDTRLDPWANNLLKNPNGNVTRLTDASGNISLTFQECIPQTNNPKLCNGNWYQNKNILCPFTPPECKNAGVYTPDLTQVTKGGCECVEYTSESDGNTKKYVGNLCEYDDNTTCNGGGIANPDGTCTCGTNYLQPDCNCMAFVYVSTSYTFLVTGTMLNVVLKNFPLTFIYSGDPLIFLRLELPAPFSDGNIIQTLDDENALVLSLYTYPAHRKNYYKLMLNFPCNHITWVPSDGTGTNLYFDMVK